MENQITQPTHGQFEAIQKAYGYFNRHLFDAELPDCFLNFSRYTKRTMGFFSSYSWENRIKSNDKVKPLHEISICPVWLNRDIKEVMSTLVHEMVHLWQQEFGKPSRGGYHNMEWARKMVNVGLFPSDTGQRFGKMTGQSMSHYILPGGLFEKTMSSMPEEYYLPFIYSHAFTIPEIPMNINDEEDLLAVAKVTRRKVKYSCLVCEINVWGKPELNLRCGECNSRLKVVF